MFFDDINEEINK